MSSSNTDIDRLLKKSENLFVENNYKTRPGQNISLFNMCELFNGINSEITNEKDLKDGRLFLLNKDFDTSKVERLIDDLKKIDLHKERRDVKDSFVSLSAIEQISDMFEQFIEGRTKKIFDGRDQNSENTYEKILEDKIRPDCKTIDLLSSSEFANRILMSDLDIESLGMYDFNKEKLLKYFGTIKSLYPVNEEMYLKCIERLLISSGTLDQPTKKSESIKKMIKVSIDLLSEEFEQLYTRYKNIADFSRVRYNNKSPPYPYMWIIYRLPTKYRNLFKFIKDHYKIPNDLINLFSLDKNEMSDKQIGRLKNLPVNSSFFMIHLVNVKLGLKMASNTEFDHLDDFLFCKLYEIYNSPIKATLNDVRATVIKRLEKCNIHNSLKLKYRLLFLDFEGFVKDILKLDNITTAQMLHLILPFAFFNEIPNKKILNPIVKRYCYSIFTHKYITFSYLKVIGNPELLFEFAASVEIDALQNGFFIFDPRVNFFETDNDTSSVPYYLNHTPSIYSGMHYLYALLKIALVFNSLDSFYFVMMQYDLTLVYGSHKYPPIPAHLLLPLINIFIRRFQKTEYFVGAKELVIKSIGYHAAVLALSECLDLDISEKKQLYEDTKEFSEIYSIQSDGSLNERYLPLREYSELCNVCVYLDSRYDDETLKLLNNLRYRLPKDKDIKSYWIEQSKSLVDNDSPLRSNIDKSMERFLKYVSDGVQNVISNILKNTNMFDSETVEIAKEL